MTKVVIRKQHLDNGKGFFQIFWMAASGSITSNLDASWDQVVGVSNVAMRATLDMKTETKSFDGGQEIIEIWE